MDTGSLMDPDYPPARDWNSPVDLAEARIKQGEFEYTIPIDMNRDVGVQIKRAMLAIQEERPQRKRDPGKEMERLKELFSIKDKRTAESACGTWLCNSCKDIQDAI